MVEASSIAAAAACAGGAAAWWAASNGVRTLRQTRADSKNRSRPMLAAELRKVPYVKGSMTLVIRNLGPTVARNVQVTFDPPIPDPEPEKTSQSVTPFLKRRYADPISTFTPGTELSNLWFVGQPGPSGRFENTEPMADRCVVTLNYEASDGTAYEDKFTIDVAMWRGETYSSSSESPDRLLKEAVKSLKAIETSLKTLSAEATRNRPSD